MSDIQYYRYTDGEPEEGARLYYSNLARDSKGPLMMVPYTQYSDYGGGTVERANCDEFMRLYGELPGVWEVYGGHGSRGVCITRALYESNEEIRDAIMGLDDYPILNDETHSNLESQIESEGWESWVRDDLTRALEKAGIPVPEDPATLHTQFQAVTERLNIYPIFEDAVSAWWPLEKIVEGWEA